MLIITSVKVGGGPCGLVLALTLAQNGVPVRIIEKNTTFHRAQRGTGIQPRSLELFKFLGVLPDIWEGSRLTKYSAIYKMPEGREIAKLVDMTAAYGDPTPDVPFRSHRNIGQCHTEEILRAHLAKYNVSLELGTELVSFSQDDEGITAEVVHHSDNTQERKIIRAQYLVGADGAKSTIRKQLNIPFVGETKEVMRLVVADIQVTGITEAHWHQWGDASSKVVRLLTTEYPGIFTLMAGGKDADMAALAASHDALLKFVYEVTNRGPDELQFGEVRSFTEFRPNIRLADRYSEKRVFLVGDAVHVHSPTGGQGLNTGIQDSFNLAWKLSLVLNHNSYNAERRPVAQDVLATTSEIMRQVLAFKAGDEPKFAQRSKTLHQLGVNYRFSDLIVDEQPRIEGGDRAPDAPGLSKSTSLFDIFKPFRHTVLLFLDGLDTPDIADIVNALNMLPRVPCILSSFYPGVTTEFLTCLEGSEQYHAHTFYPPTANGCPIVIVRPDAFVGAVVKSKEGILLYLNGVFGDRATL
ncbi:FAD binding domain-containing protein [Irpex lacteus]|nr:FAD binding domain-containing protein [Irpex lacteus]